MGFTSNGDLFVIGNPIDIPELKTLFKREGTADLIKITKRNNNSSLTGNGALSVPRRETYAARLHRHQHKQLSV